MKKVSILCTVLCVGLFVGGCDLNLRKEFDPSVAKTALDYLADKSTGSVYMLSYDVTAVLCEEFTVDDDAKFNGYVEDKSYCGYEYDGDKTLTIGGTDYIYIGDSTEVKKGDPLNNELSDADYTVINFDSEDGASRVQVMVDSDTVRVIKPRKYIDYFEDGKLYGKGWFFINDEEYVIESIVVKGYLEIYVGDSGVFTSIGGTGTFWTFSYTFDVPLDLAGNLTVNVP